MADLLKATTPTLRIVVVGVCFVGLVLGAIYLGSTKERKAMTPPKTNPVPNATLPPIDASAPPKTETATFALG
jgi:hypothetical protein